MIKDKENANKDPMVLSPAILQGNVSRVFDLSKVTKENPGAGWTTETESTEKEVIKVSVSLGDLYYCRYPVLAGHFRNDGILFAESVINEYLEKALQHRHHLGLYPGDIGTSELFLTTGNDFQGAVITGLGTPEDLTVSELIRTVEQAVAKYLLHLHEEEMSTMTISPAEHMEKGISSLIIGCGYAGLSIENSVRAIIQGVYNANRKVRNLGLTGMPEINHLEFIEVYQDKALSCLYTLSMIESENTSAYSIVRKEKSIKYLFGYKERILAEENEAWWNRITIEKEDNADSGKLTFKTHTRSSREEEQALLTTPVLLEKVISTISTDNKWNASRAKELFELMIPNDFKDQLKRHGNIIWVLDKYTASFPWELLQDSMSDAKPLCVSSGMVRQLCTPDFRRSIKTITQYNALVVADPDIESPRNQLPGALAEGKSVETLLGETFKSMGGTMISSYHEKSSEILEKIFSNDYKIIHLSGHGNFSKEHPDQTGMLIGPDQFLSVREIKQMSTVPELVFVNCCHLGKTDGKAEELYRDRYMLAANIGTQLIENGVRCVIAAGWAVADDAANDFAVQFYTRMLQGKTFGESVKAARNFIFQKYPDNNTWGAYQCYGDPFYKFNNIPHQEKKKKKHYMIEQEAEIDLANLLREMTTGKKNPAAYLETLKMIIEAVDEAEIRTPVISEKEALIYLELGDYGKASEKLGILMETEDATFSLSVVDNYCLARTKNIMNEFKASGNRAECMSRLEKIFGDLEILMRLSPTSERLCINGSMLRRKAFMAESEDKIMLYGLAAEAFRNAYIKKQGRYSLINWLTIGSIISILGSPDATSQFPSKEDALRLLKEQETSLHQDKKTMNYWDLIGLININLCRLILHYSGNNPPESEVNGIMLDLRRLWKKAGSKGNRITEAEHLELVIDELKATGKAELEDLIRQLTAMREIVVTISV